MPSEGTVRSQWLPRGSFKAMGPLYLDASVEYTEDLDLVLWNRLGEGHQDTSL